MMVDIFRTSWEIEAHFPNYIIGNLNAAKYGLSSKFQPPIATITVTITTITIFTITIKLWNLTVRAVELWTERIERWIWMRYKSYKGLITTRELITNLFMCKSMIFQST